MEILKVENLTKIYGRDMAKVTALDNVSFSVQKGEFVAIVGKCRIKSRKRNQVHNKVF